MAKDPAFLFYPGDWLGGTMGMTLEEKGAYLELLVLQWNCGRIADSAAKRLVGEQLWYKLSHKFEADGGGMFNKRLEHEKQKRKKHSENQSINAKKRWNRQSVGNASALPLENENTIEDEDVLKGGTGGKWETMPGEKYLDLELPEIKIGSVIELFKISKQTDITSKDVIRFWGIFKAQNFTGKKFYQYPSDAYSHFINWCKKQNIEKNGTAYKQNNGSTHKNGTSDARIKAAEDF